MLTTMRPHASKRFISPKRWATFLLGTCALLAAPSVARATLEVVATLPDLAALARAVGGDRVNVTCIGRPNEDPHYVQAKPSFIVTLNKADLLIENGLDLEIGWLPALVDQTRNAKIRPGAPGVVVAADGVPLLDVPSQPVTRAMGDVHPGGNPHFMLDPDRGRLVAQNIYNALVRVDPSGTEVFRANLEQLLRQIEESAAQCDSMMAPYRGTKVVTYHRSLAYFCRRFGLEEVDTVEPKPGIPPSPSHITDLIAGMRQHGAKLILMEPWHEHRTPDLVADQTGAKVVELPVQVGSAPDASDYPSLCKAVVSRVTAALR
jgi:zinc/manganese transport system substrate-binding protein